AVQLKAPSERPGVKGQDVIQRLRPKLSRVTGVSLFLNPQQDVRMGGRVGNATYQYTLKADNDPDLTNWTIKPTEALKPEPVLTDLDNDAQDNGVEAFVDIDRDNASRLGSTPRDVDNALYNSFGQRQIATLYEDINQYSVVLENAAGFGQGPADITAVHVPSSGVTNGSIQVSQAPPQSPFQPITRPTPISSAS